MTLPRRSASATIFACAGLALATVVPAAAGAAPMLTKRLGAASAGHGLSSRLAALASPELRSASADRRAERLSLPARGAGSLLRSGGRYVVDVRARSTSPRLRRAVRASGARVMDVSARYRTVTVAVAAGDLRRLAAAHGVQAVTEELTPITAEMGSGRPSAPSAAAACTGARTSEGDTQLQAKGARNAYGVTGAGVKVGLLSDSFDRDTSAPTHAAQDVASGDLPGPGNPCGRTTAVQKVDDSVAGGDEGRAMAQIVHDLAPAATMAFATANGSEAGFASNIKALQSAGSKVIVDDVSYFDEPFFQNGPVSVAVNQVTAAGAVYYSAAANSNVIVGGHNVSSWETPSIRPTSSCPAGMPSYATHCLDFNPSAAVTDRTSALTLAPGGRFILDLQWAQPWFGVHTDIDAYVLDSTNTVVAASEATNPGASGTQKPFEIFGLTNNTGVNQTVRIVLNKFAGAANPRLKYILLDGRGISAPEYPTSSGGDIVGPTIFGHNGANNAVSTAAIPFDDSNAIEPYSSRGPLALYFGPVNGTAPASPLGSPQVLAKPDLAATDGGQNTFFGTFTGGLWRFFGTSAAAPHAAAVAALELDGFPSATVAQVKSAETSTALPVDSFGVDAAGAGRVNAKAAVASLLPAVTIGDVAATEGDSGTKSFVFQLQLDKASSKSTSVRYSTANGTATAGSDYVAKTNQLVTFPAGTTSKNVTIAVKGDTTAEPNEAFSVKLSSPVRMKISDGTGVGTIQNDD
jgi:hypothetical protein